MLLSCKIGSCRIDSNFKKDQLISGLVMQRIDMKLPSGAISESGVMIRSRCRAGVGLSWISRPSLLLLL